jgi:hypothetical protein
MMKMKKSIQKMIVVRAITVIIIVSYFLIPFFPAQAYTGGISVFPPLANGPEHKTVSNFPVDTRNNNPQLIHTDLNFVESVIIETDPSIKSHLLISEYPDGDSLAFSFTVPKPFQDALVSATIFFWGPDIENMSITHVHQDEDPTQIPAVKVQPTQTNDNGDILWYFTTPSFSDFFLSNFTKKINTDLPYMQMVILLALCLSTIYVFKND